MSMMSKDEIPTRGQDSGLLSESLDKVGDILRKERLTRRITIETIAKDLKLNKDYIKALEASDYKSLPADPYIRVYIKSLTKYLSLDAEVIMKRFYEEQGVIDGDKTANKIVISVQKQEKNATVVVTLALILIFVIFAFIANQRGWIAQPNTPAPAAAAIDNTDEATTIDEESDSVAVEALYNAPPTP